jgi:hypothetical protein
MRYMECPLHDFIGGVPRFFASYEILPESPADLGALKHRDFFGHRDCHQMIGAWAASGTFGQKWPKVLVIGKTVLGHPQKPLYIRGIYPKRGMKIAPADCGDFFCVADRD